MTGARSRLRWIAAMLTLAATLLGMGSAIAHHGPPHPPKPRGAGPEDVDTLAAPVPKPKKQKTPKPAPVVKAAPSVAVLAPVALTGLQPGDKQLGLAPLAAQLTDEIIERDYAAMDALEAHLASLAGAEADPWRATAARSWIDAARHEYQDQDPTGFPQAAFARAAGLVREIEAGSPPHTIETLPPTVPPRGSARIADSLYVELDELKRHPGMTCAAAAIAELEVALAWAGNEHAGPGDCAASPHLDRARALAEEARRQAESCAKVTPP